MPHQLRLVTLWSLVNSRLWRLGWHALKALRKGVARKGEVPRTLL